MKSVFDKAAELASRDPYAFKGIDNLINRFNMAKIPTAEEFYDEQKTPLQNMVEFGRICVKAALEAAKERIELKGGNISDCNAILNAYPEHLIQ